MMGLWVFGVVCWCCLLVLVLVLVLGLGAGVLALFLLLFFFYKWLLVSFQFVRLFRKSSCFDLRLVVVTHAFGGFWSGVFVLGIFWSWGLSLGLGSWVVALALGSYLETRCPFLLNPNF